MKKNIFKIFVIIIFVFASCQEKDILDKSIFSTEKIARNEFEMWLLKNYTYPYNVLFKYKMEDIESDKKYQLVPADSAKSTKLAKIIKYMWFESYDEGVNQNFTKSNCPRIIHLIGSHAYNSEGTEVLGTAEGGLKVTLYMVNELTTNMLQNYYAMNHYYFHTMHHEFTHILNQKKPYNKMFDKISEGDYISGDWYRIDNKTAYEAGFVSPYAMSEPLEDFAEINSIYITSSEKEWENIIARSEERRVGKEC